MHEPRQPQDQDSALAFSMEGYVGTQNAGALTALRGHRVGTRLKRGINFRMKSAVIYVRVMGVRLFDDAPRHAGGYAQQILLRLRRCR